MSRWKAGSPSPACKSSIQRKGRRETWRPVVVYTYQVGSTQLQGDAIDLGEFFPSGPLDAARRICNQYSLHSSVTVYYDPLEPSRSVLDINFMKYYAFNLFGLSTFLIMGLGLVGAAAWFALQKSEGVPSRFFSVLQIVGASWFIAHVLSVLALGFSGCDQPDSAEYVWIGVGMDALAVLVAICIGLFRREAQSA